MTFLASKSGAISEDQIEEITSFHAALYKNGQAIEREYPIWINKNRVTMNITCLEKNSLAKCNCNKYVLNHLKKLSELGFNKIHKSYLGIDPSCIETCECKASSAFILFSTYASYASPIRCYDCFKNVPLYQFQPICNFEFLDIMTWYNDYKACDSLQMHCSVGERFALKQLGDPKSALSKMGLKICEELAKQTKKPFYYFLMKHYGISKRDELQRKCPLCKRPWLKQKIHRLFHFQCKNCSLLSNVAYSLRRRN